MAKAGLLFVGTDDGLVLFSDPGAAGRWLRIGHELRGGQVRAVWPLTDTPLLVLAGGPAGLWRSADGGASWRQALDLDVVDLAGDKATPQTIDLAVASGQRYRSDDGGLTWVAQDRRPVSVPSPVSAALPGREPALLAVLPQGGIGRSVDGGATFAPTQVDVPWTGEITIIAPAPYHIDTAFAGSANGQLTISADRGRTWRTIKRDLPPIRAIAAARLV